MAAIHKLSDLKVKGKLEPGRYGDGGGLYLEVSASRTKAWLYMWKTAGRRRAMGLGGYPAVSLAKARLVAAEAKASVVNGIDPFSLRQKETVPCFSECVDLFLKVNRPAWRNEKHSAQWEMTLGEAYCRSITKKAVDKITTDDILRILLPIWQNKSETASRIRGRIERVLDFAKAKGWRDGMNPALWQGHLKLILPTRVRLQRGHHAALPYKILPAFMKNLREREAVAALALEFLILSAARSGEVLNATWHEIDFDERLWNIPGNRMKAGKNHSVPLTPAALMILNRLKTVRTSDYIFPGQRPNRPLSATSIEMLLRRMKQDEITPHGFRSTFRDWAGDETHFPRDLIETALAHRVGDATERAYRRSSAIEKRRALLECWSAYCSGQDVPKNVVALRAKA
ncbi:tyrosine-type recombinase/integrase [Phyllobacterium endophyticum]|uniref:Integrase n=1 Tax=Phyllobacterium endophyticum TaxID=1149773 RepID=A0A2P7B2B4_9HYPH|nr:site-specific integrase [Phyllobacterium endophyticum]MBB3236129.1 integrase [Phyllobacterium endophyticum]PSH60592.1 integrase [Phyllobacterium endophyticum]TYR41443.1 tyrosine-type recombinase/integrase [Phyllobacterium endophyticum]